MQQMWAAEGGVVGTWNQEESAMTPLRGGSASPIAGFSTFPQHTNTSDSQATRHAVLPVAVRPLHGVGLGPADSSPALLMDSSMLAMVGKGGVSSMDPPGLESNGHFGEGQEGAKSLAVGLRIQDPNFVW